MYNVFTRPLLLRLLRLKTKSLVTTNIERFFFKHDDESRNTIIRRNAKLHRLFVVTPPSYSLPYRQKSPQAFLSCLRLIAGNQYRVR